MNQNQISLSRAADDRDDALVPHVLHDPDTGLPWPDPTTPEPDFVTLAQFLFEAVAETTDGCLVAPDGLCRHGHPSWLLRLGVI
ncbi:hypothetical protein ASF33_07400 [Methylobacterium sp. Leaf92]|nr:hypothetical protein ASF33_07400 [Methylobacterium sp. Leaf92]